jgi:hypothetical protein
VEGCLELLETGKTATARSAPGGLAGENGE